MTLVASHRILYFFSFCRALGPIDNRIISHHALVHSVKCKHITLWRPIGSFRNSEFVLMHRLSIHNIFVSIVSHCTFSFSIIHKQIIFDGVSYIVGNTSHIHVLGIRVAGVFNRHGFGFSVIRYEIRFAILGDGKRKTCFVHPFHIRKHFARAHSKLSQPNIQFGSGHQRFAFFRSRCSY